MNVAERRRGDLVGSVTRPNGIVKLTGFTSKSR